MSFCLNELMGKTFNQAVREATEREMRRRLPLFVAHREKSPYLWSGERVWRWAAGDDLHCFVILVTSQKGYNEFTFELGWSAQARFPELAMRPSAQLPNADRSEFVHEEYVCRLASVSGARAEWWGGASEVDAESDEEPGARLLADAERMTRALSPAEARAAAEQLVAAAFDDLLRHGVPYLELRARWSASRA